MTVREERDGKRKSRRSSSEGRVACAGGRRRWSQGVVLSVLFGDERLDEVGVSPLPDVCYLGFFVILMAMQNFGMANAASGDVQQERKKDGGVSIGRRKGWKTDGKNKNIKKILRSN